MQEVNFKMTDCGLIPIEWEETPLSSIGLFSKGAGISRSETGTGSLPCVRYGEIYTSHNDYIKKFYSFISPKVAQSSHRMQKGDVLMTCSGETKEDIGKAVAYLDDIEAYAGGDIIILSPFSGFDSCFLGYALNSPVAVEQKAARAQGDSVVHISAESLKKLLLPIPTGKREQERIAKALCDIDCLIISLDELIEKKQNMFQGAMQRLLSGETRLAGYDKPWEELCLGDIAQIYQPQTIAAEMFTISGYDVYGANGIVGKYSNYNHETDQVMISCRGEYCGNVNYSYGRCWITGNSMVVNTDERDDIDKKFLYFYLCFQDLHSLISGSGQPQIVREPVEDFFITIPCDKQEQQVIAKILTEMSDEINELQAEREKYQMVRDGMMQELLTGKIRLI